MAGFLSGFCKFHIMKMISFAQRIITTFTLILAPVSFLHSTQIENLVIEGESDIRQISNYAPVFSWEISGSEQHLPIFMELIQLTEGGDSLIWSSDTLPYFGNRFQFRSLGSLSPGNSYCFSVRAFSENSAQNDLLQSLTFTMNTPPQTPVPFINDRLVIQDKLASLPLKLSGDQQIPASDIAYHLQVLSDSLGGIVLIDTLIAAVDILHNNISFSPGSEFKDDAAYFYRLRAFDGVDYSDWSAFQVFYINRYNDPPESFHLISPLHNDTVNTSPVLVWRAANDPDLSTGADSLVYQIKYSTDPTFTYYVKNLQTAETEVTLSVNSLMNHKRYFWRVTAVDTKEQSAQSINTGSFTLNTGNQAPEVPNIIAPQDNQALNPSQYILWQFKDDPDGLTVYHLHYLFWTGPPNH